MKITKNFLAPNQYSRPKTPLHEVKKIIVHWVANPKSTAKNNRDYFNGLKVGKKNSAGNYIYASSHYIVDDNTIIQCMPETEVAYASNSANGYSLSIECCHPDWGGRFSPDTYTNLIDLCAYLCTKHGLNPHTDILRHYDITGKVCPKWFVEDIGAYEQFKGAVSKVMAPPVKSITIDLNGQHKAVQALIHEGATYVKLRDLANNRLWVDYDELPCIITWANNTIVPDPVTDPSTANFKMAYNGHLHMVHAYVINNYTYVKLRDLQSQCIHISYDGMPIVKIT